MTPEEEAALEAELEKNTQTSRGLVRETRRWAEKNGERAMQYERLAEKEKDKILKWLYGLSSSVADLQESLYMHQAEFWELMDNVSVSAARAHIELSRLARKIPNLDKEKDEILAQMHSEVQLLVDLGKKIREEQEKRLKEAESRWVPPPPKGGVYE